MTVLNLFKYYAPKYKGEDNLSFYSHGAIYFQQPKIFNDPWDCKAPQITIPRQINSLKDIWFNLAKQNGQDFAEAEWQKLKKSSRSEIKQRLENSFKEPLEKLRSKIGVFSLSFIPDSELMWSHYAYSHFGYVLHFQIDCDQYYADPNLKKVGIPILVIYKDKRDVFNFREYSIKKNEFAYNLVRFKSSAWEYEYELRLLNVDKYGFIKTPSNWLKSIIIGINTEMELEEKLKHIGNELNVSVFSSEMNKKEFKIDIPGLGVDGNDGKINYRKLIDSRKFEL